jgi:hypothetical protein
MLAPDMVQVAVAELQVQEQTAFIIMAATVALGRK